MSKLKSDIRRNKDHSTTNERLKVLLAASPKAPVRFRQIYNDATPAAIKDSLCGRWRSIGLMSDEAGTIFNGYALNELPFINKMWDGAMFPVERKSEPDKLIKDARMTLGLMIQPDVFKKVSGTKRRCERDRILRPMFDMSTGFNTGLQANYQSGCLK
jgi:hypothetical protein